MSETELKQPQKGFISAVDVEALLDGSDVIGIKLTRAGRAWRCKAHGLRAAGGATAPTMLQAVHDAVVLHNMEWDKLVNG